MFLIMVLAGNSALVPHHSFAPSPRFSLQQQTRLDRMTFREIMPRANWHKLDPLKE